MTLHKTVMAIRSCEALMKDFDLPDVGPDNNNNASLKRPRRFFFTLFCTVKAAKAQPSVAFYSVLLFLLLAPAVQSSQTCSPEQKRDRKIQFYQ